MVYYLNSGFTKYIVNKPYLQLVYLEILFDE